VDNDDIPLMVAQGYDFGRETMSPVMQRVLDFWLQEEGTVSPFSSYIDEEPHEFPWRDSE
jgi:hypothetical protein